MFKSLLRALALPISLPLALLVPLALPLGGCSAEAGGDVEASETSEAALTPCPHEIRDRTAETLAAMPFQKLDRGALPADVAAVAWGYPTPSRSVPGNFGAGRSYNEGHEGADIGGASGEAILAAAAGTVVYTLTSCPNDNAGRNRLCGNGWGKHVVVRHAPNVYTRYAHLSAVPVKVGDQVTKGQRIGSLGISGLSDGPHLHFELGKRATPFSACGAPQNFDSVHDPAKLAYDRAPASTFPKGCLVATDSANVRAEPNGTILTTLQKGSSVQAIAAEGTWFAVTFRYQQKDWGTAASPAFIHSSQLSCR